MKIRNGYVSNSSSSSFLLICQSKDEFSQFKDFKGYDILISNFKNSPEEHVINFIDSYLVDFWYDTKDKYTKRDFDFFNINEFKKINYINFLFEKAEIDSECYFEIIREYNQKGFEFYEKYRGDYSNSEYKEFVNSYYENDELKTKINKIAENIYKNMKEKYIFNCVEYEDHNAEGYYMQQQFMPFVASNPDKSYEILIINNH